VNDAVWFAFNLIGKGRAGILHRSIRREEAKEIGKKKEKKRKETRVVFLSKQYLASGSVGQFVGLLFISFISISIFGLLGFLLLL